MRLLNARIWHEPVCSDIHIAAGSITSVKEADADRGRFEASLEADLQGAWVVPGFINSHDHLDFNCFPSLASGVYPDYRAWGADIHSRFADQIRSVKQIPQELRNQWGMYKNLLNGFTTVVNHGERIQLTDPLITLIQDGHILHSPGFEKQWKWKLNHPFRRGKPYVIHAGEGTSETAAREIHELAASNWMNKEIIVVHGVAMQPEQAIHFKGLVWCPASNYFLLGETAAIGQLQERIPVVFGTDSTLSAAWDCWQHFRIAKTSATVSDEQLLRMLTGAAAVLWRLPDKGAVSAGKKADLLVIEPGNGLFDGDAGRILLLIQNGEIRLIDQTMIPSIKGFSLEGYSRIMQHRRVKWVKGDLPGLVREIRSFYSELHIPFRF